MPSGASVWENYTGEIILDYTYGGAEYSERWTYNVGGWSMEMFTYDADVSLTRPMVVK